MSGFFWLLLVLLHYPAFAGSTIISMIHDVDIDPHPGEDALVFLSTGEVGRIPMTRLSDIDALKEGRDQKIWFKLKLSKTREILSFREVEKPGFSGASEDLFLKNTAPFAPTVVKSLSSANAYFLEAKLKPKESQCFNRAHVWSYELFKKHKVLSNKIFLFFTRKYIRETNFGWWFHVAPLIHVAVGKDIKERVMDRKYSKGPSTVHQWIGAFMKEGHPCATVTTYSDYANFPESNYCYIMRSSMYYYWPLDLEREELYGYQKSGWKQDELKMAYQDALGLEPLL